MRAVIYISVVLALSTAVASAQEQCGKIKNDAERLACYDLTSGGVSTTSEMPTKGKWDVQTELSPMTDEKTVVARLASEESIPGKFNLTKGPAKLFLRCQENKTSAYFTFNDHFMADIQGYGKIEYRLGTGALKRVNSAASTDSMALGLWSGGAAIPFIKGLYGHETMTVRVTPFNESAITVTFAISDAENAVTGLREACGW